MKPAADITLPSQRIRGEAYCYGLAIVFVAVALGVGLLARHYGIGHQFAMLLFAVAVSGWNGGLGPAIVAAVLSSLAYDYFITEPIYRFGFTKYDLIDLALYISFAFLITRFRHVRWRMEGKLRASEKKYRELIDSSPDAIFVWNDAGRCVLANASAVRLFGCTEEELTTLSAADTYVSDERARLHERNQRARKEGVVRYERQFLRKNNEIIPVEVSLSTAGEGLYQSIVRDITDRKEAEEELRKQAELLSLANDAIIVRDSESRIIFWNLGARRAYGWTAAEAFGKVTHELLRTRFAVSREAVDIALQEEGEWEGELTHVTRDGAPIVVASRQSLRRDQRGSPAVILEINRDVTESKRAEEALREAEKRYRTLVEQAPEAIVVVDVEEGRFVDVNENAVRLFGFPREALLRLGPIAVSPAKQPDGRPSAESAVENMRNAVEGGHPVFEWRHVNKAGEQIPCEIRLVRLPATQRILVRGSVTDITERKKVEETLRQYREELEVKVTQRTAALSRANAELKAVNKELEAFAYSVSHDLRAPVRHIAGFTELLQRHAEPNLDDKSRQHIDMILDSANRMDHLIEDLLAFSRIGRAETQRTTVRLDEVVKGIISQVAPDTQGRKISWRISELPICYGDSAMLRLVFGNLISNALKFTRTREQAEIEIGAVNHKPDDLVVFVKDNGVGFDMKYKDKLFGVFQRLHSQDAFEGTGIGLATVQRIVHRHGGRVWAEGAPNNGAAFYVALPKPTKP